MKPFEPNKTAEELGIDKTRKFVVVNPVYPHSDTFFRPGVKVAFVKDTAASGKGAFFTCGDGREAFMFWHELAYAEEEGPETLGFMECDTCRAKPDTPDLCLGCLHNRAAIERLKEWRQANTGKPEPYQPRVGDRVSVECIVSHVSHISTIVYSCHAGINGGTMSVAMADVKLLSRKPPRKVTMEEVRGKFGEDVEIVG